MASIFAERHRGMIQGGISCFDRVAITGPLPDIGIPGQWRLASGISKGLLKDCPRRAEPSRCAMRFVSRLSVWRRRRVFRSRSSASEPLGPDVHSVKASQVAIFPGRMLTAANYDEIGSDFNTRIRHAMNKNAIRLCIGTTTNDVTFFELHRWVEQHNGETVQKPARSRQTNDCCFAFIASIDNPDAGWKTVDRTARPARDKKRSRTRTAGCSPPRPGASGASEASGPMAFVPISPA